MADGVGHEDVRLSVLRRSVELSVPMAPSDTDPQVGAASPVVSSENERIIDLILQGGAWGPVPAGDAALRQRLPSVPSRPAPPDVPPGLSVHVPCGQVRGPVRRSWRGDDQQVEQTCPCQPVRPRWPGVDVSETVQLCTVCARGPAGGPTRWAWLACWTCRRVRDRSDDLRLFLLPLGRHSVTNGQYIRGARTAKNRQKQQATVASAVAGWQELHEWALLESTMLATRFGGLHDVPLAQWMTELPESQAASVNAATRLVTWCERGTG